MGNEIFQTIEFFLFKFMICKVLRWILSSFCFLVIVLSCIIFVFFSFLDLIFVLDVLLPDLISHGCLILYFQSVINVVEVCACAERVCCLYKVHLYRLCSNIIDLLFDI